MLKTTLEMVAGHAEGQLGLCMYFHLLGKVHRRHQVSADMFEQWRDTLIQAAAEFNPRCDAQTRGAWEYVIDYAVSTMHQRFRAEAAQPSGA